MRCVNRATNPHHAMKKIDVIIPVYRGLAETKACIDSVLAAKNDTPCEVIIINDASPDREVCDYLNQLTPEPGRLSVITHEQNRGFVVSCNRGMAAHPDRDVVLLNSDTEVCDGWLDRLARCAYSQSQIASVSPFSNNATLASYPHFCQTNDLPANMPLAELDALFMRQNSGKSVEIPTGVGFCMYMRRAAIDAVGNFDEAAFGLGYGEENDWCLRATAAGYRHLLCADTFVYHRGEVSFGAGGEAKRRHAQQIIDSRYPHYSQLIADHMREDPARPLRRAVDLARLTGSSLPRLLLVTHNWGGGVERHIQDLIKLVADRAEVLVLRPHDVDTLSLTWVRPGEAFVAYFNRQDGFNPLVEALRQLAMARVHIHHIHGLPAEILTLATALNVPLDITLHDHYPLTPAYHLAEGGVGVQEAAHPWGWGLREWQSAMHTFLQRAARIICPSQYLASQITAAFPDIAPLVWAHPAAPVSPVRPVKVLVLGRMTATKGLQVVADSARDAKARGLPLFFTLVGPTVMPIPTFPELPIRIHGSYDDQDLATLIALERADVVLFPSQIPESYSYT
ncbi:MAG: glycosyltransferase, partial [Betaproteobacteria bacterium]|nr:glycosyltransferase [Betaproteobacteria bacterium]